jgi:hypothetical protein
MPFISRAKDFAIEKALILFLRPKVKRYGDLRRLSVDTTSKILTAEIRMLGDPLPLEATEVHYRVEESTTGLIIIFFDFKLSKEWIQNLVDDQFPEIRLPIPDFIKPLIE